MKTELRVLFYSPIAWLILVVFALQAGVEFSDSFAKMLRYQALGYNISGITMRIFGGFSGVMAQMLDKLYLYIPLLTMGLMSRELSSGSIKLLYSSPVSNIQIIAGKYLSVMVYGLVFVAIIGLQMAFSWFLVKDMDLPAVWVGILGLYLAVCAYGAIGLFMSTVTHYQVVAAIGTLAVLAGLNFIGGVGQEYDFVRDITYWLSISGRSKTFMEGMVNSSDVLYFLLVIFMFLILSVIKLHGERSKFSLTGNVLKYGAVVVVVLMLGYVTSRPRMVHYYDATSTKSNTLTEQSQAVVKNLKGGLTLTSYVNLLEDNYGTGMPSSRNWDFERFEKYVRFKPEMKIKYVYYYHRAYNPFLDQRFPDLNDKERMEKMCDYSNYDKEMFRPYEEIAGTIDLSGENYRFVRTFERESGERVFLRLYEDQTRHPSEAEISTALKTLYARSPRVGFVTGHDERSIDNMGGRGYGIFARENTFRYALHNQGFTVETLSLAAPVDPQVDIMVISDMRKPFTDAEMENYKAFIARGGNLIVLGEPKRQQSMNAVVEPLGLRFTEDMLVQPSEEFLADLVIGRFTPALGELSAEISRAVRYEDCLTTVSTCGVEQAADAGFEVIDGAVTDSVGVWNERQTRNFIDEVPVCDPKTGEVEKSYSLVKYLTREVDGREQRIFVISDADCIAGGELSTRRNGIDAANFSLIRAMFTMLSYGEFPLEASRERPSDNKIYLDQDDSSWVKLLFDGAVPAALLIGSLVVWMRRRGR